MSEGLLECLHGIGIVGVPCAEVEEAAVEDDESTRLIQIQGDVQLLGDGVFGATAVVGEEGHEEGHPRLGALASPYVSRHHPHIHDTGGEGLGLGRRPALIGIGIGVGISLGILLGRICKATKSVKFCIIDKAGKRFKVFFSFL